jgi:hypothetical protein
MDDQREKRPAITFGQGSYRLMSDDASRVEVWDADGKIYDIIGPAARLVRGLMEREEVKEEPPVMECRATMTTIPISILKLNRIPYTIEGGQIDVFDTYAYISGTIVGATDEDAQTVPGFEGFVEAVTPEGFVYTMTNAVGNKQSEIWPEFLMSAARPIDEISGLVVGDVVRSGGRS